MSSAGNVSTRSSEKKILCSNEVSDIKDEVETLFGKNFFGSGSVNTFPAAVFFENRQFFLKIFKISKCSSSLNFKDRKNLNPFLKSLKPLLSVAHTDREDLFSEKFSKNFHVNKVKIEDFDIYICHPQGTC